MEKIKVLIVDDSAVVRQTLKRILTADGRIEVTGTASNPFVAADKIKNEIPDVITLDIEMPRMNGITFLKKIMTQNPLPVVICSSHTGKGSKAAIKAMEYGAVDIIQLPKVSTKQFLLESSILICDAVKAAAHTKKRLVSRKTSIEKYAEKLTADVVLSKTDPKVPTPTTEKVIVVGASTGGTTALQVFLRALPLKSPGIVVVQHMPEHFTTTFAESLNAVCRVSVKEAANNDSVIPGHVLIAPGNKHTLLKRRGIHYYVEVEDGPLVSRHRPSVDVLFRSASRYAGKNACGVIMTGMGDDGAEGMLEMKETGATNIAQDKGTSVVFGMPQEAIKAGGVDHILPLPAIAGKAIRICGY